MNRSEASAPGPTELFTIVGARALTATPLQPHLVWLGELDGHVYGVMTSPVGHVSGGVTADTLRRHATISAIQRCFLSDEFVELMKSTPVDPDQIFDDLAEAVFDQVNVKVHGAQVRCSTITYRGVEFAASHDPQEWPFTLARPASQHASWPPLDGPAPGPVDRR